MTRPSAWLLTIAATLLGAAPALAQQTCAVPLNGTWEITFAAGAITHQGTLVMSGCTGTLRVSFYSTQNQRQETITQGMSVTQAAQGILIVGSNPVYAGTTTPHPGYSADNLLYSIDPQGRTVFRNCDMTNPCSPVEIVSQQIAGAPGLVPAAESQVRISLRNLCVKTVSVAVWYRTPSRFWRRKGWWNVAPGAAVETDVSTTHNLLYFFGEDTDGSFSAPPDDSTGVTGWVVNESFLADSSAAVTGSNPRQVRFFRRTLTMTDPTYVQRFTCEPR